ncbi:hypothetical protein [Cyclobacterium jeungdonense]|uniref:Uncharacterized protein n=1 Tax=Cyclobacterium jeungdonense TaxID=708087 RepID=A0ABT8C9C6_9BACT|nr:hypothetical protein [Cyclobacterium jeungdonense]MDN3689374.1 hypothetical protein [Cyclobacterium jeungdonense]
MVFPTKPVIGILFFSLSVLSCNLEQGEENLQEAEFTQNCSEFSYPDTLFFISETPEKLIEPVGVSGSGVFSAHPEGLAIDPETGVINVNASETGLKYEVSFTQEETQCQFFLTIAGINYLDGIFVVDRGEGFIQPVFNGEQSALPPCDEDDDNDDDDLDEDDEDDDDDDDEECEFDEESPGGERLADQGLIIENATGTIDLQQTLQNNFFGAQPENGVQKDVTLYYRLNDGSMRALNSIGLKFFYYESMEDVPQTLIDEIQAKQDQILSTKPSSGNLRLNFDRPRSRRPRPPYLVVVSRFSR